MNGRTAMFLAASVVVVGLTGTQAWPQIAGETAHPPGDRAKGRSLYEASCVVCHGPGGTGGIGPKLVGNAVLADDRAFWKVVYEGRHVMPPLKGPISEQQMADIRAWLKTLR